MDATGHDDNKTALAPAGDSTVPAPADHEMTEIEKHLGDLAASPQFVPLMGSFRELLDAERRRNRVRTLLISAGMLALLVLFIWGPLHLIRTYIRLSEQRLAGERESLHRVEHSLNESMTVLADASRELRKTLEACRPTPATGAQPVVEPATPQVTVTTPAAVAPVAPLLIATPLPPHPVGVATTLPPAVVAAVMPPAATPTGKVTSAAATPAKEQTPPIAKQTVAPGLPPDVFRAVTSTPAVPVTVAVNPPMPAATNRAASAAVAETRLDDALANVERTIQAIKQKNAPTNAATTKKP